MRWLGYIRTHALLRSQQSIKLLKGYNAPKYINLCHYLVFCLR